MEITYDIAKKRANAEKHGVSFDLVSDFDFDTAVITVDDRRDYGETRLKAMGYVGDRLHALVFTKTTGGIRVISFRKANKRERTCYDQTE